MALFKISLVAVGLLHLLGTAEASPAARSIIHSTIVERADELLPEYDYIIVGGGTAGLTVADRLTENGKRMLKAVSCSFTNKQATNLTCCNNRLRPGLGTRRLP
jgi:hypothetical protein